MITMEWLIGFWSLPHHSKYLSILHFSLFTFHFAFFTFVLFPEVQIRRLPYLAVALPH